MCPASGRLSRRASSAAPRVAVAKRGQQRRVARRDRPRARRLARENARERVRVGDRPRGARWRSARRCPGCRERRAARARAAVARRAVISAPDASPASTTSTVSASATMMRLRAGNCFARGGVPGGYSESRPPAAATIVVQRRVAIGIDDVDAAAEHREGHAARVERAAMRGRVDPERAARDDREALPRGPRRHLAREPAAGHRRRARADDRQARGQPAEAAVPGTRAP